MRPWTSSLRVRLTLWYTLILGAPLIALAVVSDVLFTRVLQERTDQFIGDALTAFARELGAERRASPTAVQAMRSTVDEVRFRDLRIFIVDEAGGVVAASSLPGADGTTPPSSDDRILAWLRASPPSTMSLPARDGDFRVMSRRLEFDGGRYLLAAAFPLRESQVMLERIQRAYLVAIPLILFCAASGGYILAKHSLAPVSAMVARAAEISATNLHERLPGGGTDELGDLARVMNELLDRLDRSFAQQRRFMADASHELRTPTAILRTEADVTLSRDHREEGEYRESVAIMQDASRRLTRIVEDLFLLGRADAGHVATAMEFLYLEEVVHDAVRGVRPLADRRGVQLQLGEVVDAPVSGDADLLGRLMLNLLDNAVKFSPRSTTVLVEMRRDESQVSVAVTDAGPGIPPEARDRIFERFFRVDTARSRSENSTTSGAGLGLAIARRIAELHGGAIDLVTAEPGRTQFRFSMPLVPERTRADV